MIYLSILLLVVVTIIFGKISVKLGFSSVVGQLLSGVVLGASFLNVVQTSDLMHVISETGVCLLMLNSGLESDLKEMRKHIRASTRIAVLGVVVPAIVFPLICLLLGYTLLIALFAGVVFSATSISITLAVLSEQKQLAKPMGAIIIAAAVLDDIIALAAVTLFSIVIGGGTLGISSLLPLIAFAAGILLRQLSFSARIGEVTTTLGQWFFYPVFFGSIGLTIAVQGLNDKILPIIIFSLLAVMTKFVGSTIGASLSGLNRQVAYAIGAGMISRGEMALVIIQIGVASHIINSDTVSEFIVTVIISTIVAPLMMKPLFAKV